MQPLPSQSLEVCPAVECNYQLLNLWNLPLGRLRLFCEPFVVPEGYARVVQASKFWFFPAALDSVGDRVAELRPFSRATSRLQNLIIRLTGQFPLGPERPGIFCSMIAPFRRQDQYFHWLLDLLPGLLEAESYCLGSGDGKPVILLERPLKTWQAESLQLLGYSKCQFWLGSWVSLAPVRVEKLFVTEYSRASIGTGPLYDAISPFAVSKLRQRLGQIPQSRHILGLEESRVTPIKLYISRADAATRRIVNESELEPLLLREGFRILRLSEISFARQIGLFQEASHILSIHGGGLANLVFAAHAYVLEIHSLGHKIRPEYFQIASINKCKYSYYCVKSLNKMNDIYLPKRIVKEWLSFAGG